jgi:hypothetical protein
MNILAIQGASYQLSKRDYSSFLRFLKECEDQIPVILYSTILRDYVERVISENLVQSNLWKQALTSLQLEIVEDHL